MEKKLIVTADDYGVWTNIDRGIRNCAKKAVLDNIDIMVTQGRYSNKSVKQLIRENKMRIKNGELNLGLHLSLSCGSPLYRNNREYLKRIAERFHVRRTGDAKYIFRYSSGRKMIENIEELVSDHKESLRREMIAQYEAFKKMTGRKPSQVSSHLGVYNANDDIYEVLSAFCQEEGIPMRCPTLISLDSTSGDHWDDPKQKLLPVRLLELITQKEGKDIIKWIRNEQRAAYEKDRSGGVEGWDYFVEHFFKNGSIANLNLILDNIRKTEGDTFEMVVHPVHSKKKGGKPTGISGMGFGKRYDEYLVLVSDEGGGILRGF